MKERFQQERHQVHNKNERVHRKNRSRARVKVCIDFAREERGGRQMPYLSPIRRRHKYHVCCFLLVSWVQTTRSPFRQRWGCRAATLVCNVVSVSTVLWGNQSWQSNWRSTPQPTCVDRVVRKSMPWSTAVPRLLVFCLATLNARRDMGCG